MMNYPSDKFLQPPILYQLSFVILDRTRQSAHSDITISDWLLVRGPETCLLKPSGLRFSQEVKSWVSRCHQKVNHSLKSACIFEYIIHNHAVFMWDLSIRCSICWNYSFLSPAVYPRPLFMSSSIPTWSSASAVCPACRAKTDCNMCRTQLRGLAPAWHPGSTSSQPLFISLAPSQVLSLIPNCPLHQ